MEYNYKWDKHLKLREMEKLIDFTNPLGFITDIAWIKYNSNIKEPFLILSEDTKYITLDYGNDCIKC